jgi:hypothetical protein
MFQARDPAELLVASNPDVARLPARLRDRGANCANDVAKTFRCPEQKR